MQGEGWMDAELENDVGEVTITTHGSAIHIRRFGELDWRLKSQR